MRISGKPWIWFCTMICLRPLQRQGSCILNSLLICGFCYFRTCLPSYNILLFLKPEKCLLFHLPVGYHRQNISYLFSKLSGTLKTNSTALFVHEMRMVFLNELFLEEYCETRNGLFIQCWAVLSMNYSVNALDSVCCVLSLHGKWTQSCVEEQSSLEGHSSLEAHMGLINGLTVHELDSKTS